jgi:DNA-binding GntR family transcriptional regulator
LAPELQRPLPPYLQITQFYRDQIDSGELKEGDRIPSARQIVERWKVAHATAAKVLSTLRAEGLVTTTSGGAGGTVVTIREQPKPAPGNGLAAVKRRDPVHPRGEHSTVAAAEIVRAPKWIAEALEVDAGVEVIRRHRVTYRDATPVAASTSWFDAALAKVAPALLATDKLRQGTTEYLAEQTGRAMSQGRDQIAAGVADDATAADLDVSKGSPVLVGRNWVRDNTGMVLEYAETVSVPGRWSTYEWQTEP